MVNDCPAMMDYEMYPQLFVEGLRDKDPAVRDYLVRRYRVWAVRHAMRHGAGAESEDIAHDALVAILEKPPLDAIERGVPMRAIVFVKVYDRVCIARLKQGRLAPLATSRAESGPRLSSEVGDYRMYLRVREALNRLATPDRELIEARYLKEMKAVELANEDRSAAAVRGGVFRALGQLRRSFKLAS